MDIFLAVAKEYGPIGAVAVFFAWQSYNTRQRIVALENWTRRVLLVQLKKNTKALTRTTTILERLEQYLDADKSKS